MSFFSAPKNNYPPRELAPEGKYTAVLYLAVDCGTNEDTYNGVSKLKHDVYLAWELVDTAMSDGRPFTIGNTYTITDGKFGPYFAKTSNANKMLRSWTGMDEKACSKANLLGKLIEEQTPCTISVGVQQGRKDPTKEYNIIESVKPYKGKPIKGRANAPILYAIRDGEVPEEVYPWLKDRIASCLENTNPAMIAILKAKKDEDTGDEIAGEIVPF